VSFLLDTDVCSAYLRGNPAVFSRAVQHSGGLHVSAITVGELFTWVSRRSTPPSRAAGVRELLGFVTVLDFNAGVAETFGRVRGALLDAGRPVPLTDLMIAATAIHHDLTMVTHNVADYTAVPGLRIQDWLSP
jgi:tRNA(fMet)-specific endonuclease VapC